MVYLQKGTTTISVTKREFYIGRSSENDLVIDELSAPDCICRLIVDKENCSIEGLSSWKELRLNGEKVKNRALTNGDMIQFGKVSYVYTTKKPELPDSGESSDSVLNGIIKFTDAVGKERDLRILLRKIIETLLNLLGGNEAFVFTIAKGKPELFISSKDADIRKRFSDTIVQQVLTSGKGLWVGNALTDPSFANAPSIVDLHLKSVLCCPMIVAEKCVGIIYIGSHDPLRSFTSKDLEALQVYAQMAGMLINHVEYIAQQSTVIKRLSEPAPEGVIAKSPQMLRILQDVDATAHSDITVLLQGETGTGKDVMAQLIHNRSERKNGRFMAVNCSSLRGELLESELFGHKRGAFTGAVSDHGGLFMAADGGTLFLDEIGEMDIQLQAKLLRTLEVGKVRPVGSVTEEKVNVRIVAATNRNLEKMVQDGTFRQDLYYRLNQFTIVVPPLRERGDDILHLAYFFLEKYRAQYPNKSACEFDAETIKTIMMYEWPGNIRELSSVVHRAVLTSTGPIITIDMIAGSEVAVNFEQATKEFQKRLLSRALVACEGNKEKAASMLELSRSTFFRHVSVLEVR